MDKQIPLTCFLDITNGLLESNELSKSEREGVCLLVDKVLMSKIGLYQGFRLLESSDGRDPSKRHYL